MWDLLILRPFVNALLLIYAYLGHDFTISITLFTVLLRMILYPLTISQQKQAKAMQALQPELQALQKKYGKDREKIAQAQMELYKQAGINPLGGCLPLLLQFPIMIGMYQAIVRVMAVNPLQLFDLSKHLYPFLPQLTALLPVNNQLLWLDLGQPDPYYVVPILVAITTFFSQKVMTPPSTGDDQSAMVNKQMMYMMPLMFAYFTTLYASGLGIYFIVSNLVSIVQYWLVGRSVTGIVLRTPVLDEAPSAPLPTPVSSDSGSIKRAAGKPKRRRKS